MALKNNTNPLVRFQRDIDTDQRLTDDTRRHLHLWLKKVVNRYSPQELSHQVILASAADNYRERQIVSMALRNVAVDSPEYMRLIGILTKLDNTIAKLLRVSGLSTKTKGKGKGDGKGSVFPPTRNRRPSELDAEAVA